jgi:hypothetical protein
VFFPLVLRHQQVMNYIFEKRGNGSRKEETLFSTLSHWQMQLHAWVVILDLIEIWR